MKPSKISFNQEKLHSIVFAFNLRNDHPATIKLVRYHVFLMEIQFIIESVRVELPFCSWSDAKEGPSDDLFEDEPEGSNSSETILKHDTKSSSSHELVDDLLSRLGRVRG